jgi:glucose/arabinose dehydrogenase
MISRISRVALASLVLCGSTASAQGSGAPAQAPTPGLTTNPFPQPIAAADGVIAVTVREFASLPDIDGIAARMMTLVEDPSTRRLFVSDMRGVLYAVSPDGKTVTPYLSLLDAKWSVPVQSQGRERGLQSFVLHPQYGQAGTPGFGKFYTYADTTNQVPPADFTTPNTATTHDLVLHEWTAKTPGASAYDGGMPREVLRWRQPFANHNGGAITFNSTARAGTPDFGLLYIGVGDGGSGGDPMNLSQNLGSAFGKILRIDPLGKNGRGGKFGIPNANPFRTTADALPEIFAYGVRNAQRFGWDPKSGAMYMSDIGQNTVEELTPVTVGANLGWNIWEGSYRFGGGRTGVNTEQPRSDPKVIYPIAEYDQLDPVLLPNTSSAAVGALVYRSTTVPQLNGRILFGDMPSGELFHVSADDLPKGGQDPLRRVLFRTEADAAPRKLLEIIQEKNRAQGKAAVAARADMRFDMNAAGQIFLLNKGDGTIRIVER